MLLQNNKTLALLPRITVKPLQMLFRFDLKHRQRACLRNLDARTLKDIGMSDARRDEELQNWANW